MAEPGGLTGENFRRLDEQAGPATALPAYGPPVQVEQNRLGSQAGSGGQKFPFDIIMMASRVSEKSSILDMSREQPEVESRRS
jgi:hypothetical protein